MFRILKIGSYIAHCQIVVQFQIYGGLNYTQMVFIQHSNPMSPSSKNFKKNKKCYTYMYLLWIKRYHGFYNLNNDAEMVADNKVTLTCEQFHSHKEQKVFPSTYFFKKNNGRN